jgi:predicted dehydrogenase
MEVGTHLIDQALALLGPVVDVHAELASMREGALAEDDVFLALQHADGSRSHLFAGALGDDSLPRFQLASGDTLITLEEPDRQQRQMAEGIMPGHQIWGEVQPQRWEIRRGTDPIRSVLPERGCWEVFYARVVDWVIAGAEPPVSAEEGVATMRIIDAARSGASRVRVDEAV